MSLRSSLKRFHWCACSLGRGSGTLGPLPSAFASVAKVTAAAKAQSAKTGIAEVHLLDHPRGTLYGPSGGIEPSPAADLLLGVVLLRGQQGVDAVRSWQLDDGFVEPLLDGVQRAAYGVPQKNSVHPREHLVHLVDDDVPHVLGIRVQSELQVLLLREIRIVLEQELELVLQYVACDETDLHLSTWGG